MASTPGRSLEEQQLAKQIADKEAELEALRANKEDPDQQVFLRERIKQLSEKELLLLRQTGQNAGTTTATPDSSSAFLQQLPVPVAIPRFEALEAAFTQGLRRNDGTRVHLPVEDHIYAQLSVSDSTLPAFIEPASASNAWRLGVWLGEALRRDMSNGTDEFEVAGAVDTLLWEVFAMMAGARQVSITRKRNRTDASLTIKALRPDFMCLSGNTLLFKGEDKPSSGSLADAKSDLLNKMREWSGNYFGKVDYLLCYAAAGHVVELCAISKHGNQLQTVAGPFDLAQNKGKLLLAHAAIVAFAIMQLQMQQLLRSYKPLGHTVNRPSSFSCIQYMDGYVLKEVDLTGNAPFQQHLRSNLEFLQQLYAAVQHSEFVVQAQEGPAMRTRGQKLVLKLAPIGADLGPSWAPESLAELACAVRCILKGLQHLHLAGCGHADLRWSNVVATGHHKFMLIDLECALKLDSTPPPGLTLEAWHGHEALEDGKYTSASDLFQLGHMLREALHNCRDGSKAAGAHDLAEQLIAKQLTVAEALAHVWVAGA